VRCFDGRIRNSPDLADWGFSNIISSSRIQKGSRCPRSTRCPDTGLLCVWQDPYLQGDRLVFRDRGFSDRLSEELDDDATSVIVPGKERAFLYLDADGGGGDICLSGPRVVPHLDDIGFDNQASSSRITGPGLCN